MKRFFLSASLALGLALPAAAGVQAAGQDPQATGQALQAPQGTGQATQAPTQPAPALQPAACQFLLGFKALHDLDPNDVGSCVDNQASAANGDTQQHTSKGLLAWRKKDNWTAFTNGYMTWINGPGGLVSRLNSARFSWEDDTPAPADSSSSAASAAASAGSPNLSGAWRLENNGAVYSFDQDQDNYVIIMPQQMRQCTASGQSIIPVSVDANTIKAPMNQVFTGTLTGNSLGGNWLVCATVNQSWVPQAITFTVSPDGNQIAGQLQETLTFDRI